MESIPGRFWWMDWEGLQIRCLAHSVATIAGYFATTRSMGIKRWKDHYWKSSVQHPSGEKPPQMDRNRSVEMLALWEFHLHHHQNSPEDEFWPQTPTTGPTSPSLTTSLSLITPIRNPLTTTTPTVPASGIFTIATPPPHTSSKRKTARWTARWTIRWTTRWTVRWTIS